MKRKIPTWPVLLLCLPAFVAIWGGWVGLGQKTGFGTINLLPGMVDEGGWATLNTAITLPIGLETYAAFALHAALNATRRGTLRKFAAVSAFASLILGGAGQVAYHIMESLEWDRAPIWVTAVVGSLPVLVLGMGTALAVLIRRDEDATEDDAKPKLTLVQRVAAARATALDVAAAAKGTPAPPASLPAPFFGPEPVETPELPIPVSPAVERIRPTSPAGPRARGQWDMAKAVRLIMEGDLSDADVASMVNVGVKMIQRTRRAARLLSNDPRATVPTEWKVPATVLDILRREVQR